MTEVIFENSIGSIESLGMRGEYPYSSFVGRRFRRKKKVVEIWFATEINSKGELEADYCVRTFREWLQSGVDDGKPDWFAEALAKKQAKRN